MNTMLKHLLISCLLIVIYGCYSTNRLEVELSGGIPMLEVTHLDTLLFGHLSAGFQWNDSLVQSNEALLKVYIEEILQVAAYEDQYMPQKLAQFVETPHWEELQQVVDSAFYPFDNYQAAFENAFAHYQYHFPGAPIPKLFTYNSGFNYGVFPTDSTIGVGLEWYIGSQHAIVERLPGEIFPQYLKKNMESEYLVADALKGWFLVKNYHPDLLKSNFLENLIFYGKALYLVDACLPYEKDQVKLNYTNSELKWVNDNLKNIWAEIVKNKWLFTKDRKVMNQWLLDAPFTKGLPQESPGKVGVWLGLEMVRQYMNKHEDKPLSALNDVPAEQILKNFKPNK